MPYFTEIIFLDQTILTVFCLFLTLLAVMVNALFVFCGSISNWISRRQRDEPLIVGSAKLSVEMKRNAKRNTLIGAFIM